MCLMKLYVALASRMMEMIMLFSLSFFIMDNRSGLWCIYHHDFVYGSQSPDGEDHFAGAL
jgi:hypothetical protein